MKKMTIIVVSLLLVLGVGGYTFAQMGGGMMGQRGMDMMGGGMMGGGMMGPGQGGGMMQNMQNMMNMMSQCSRMMGMMGQMGQPSATAQQPSEPLTQDQARERVEKYLNSLGNPNLKVGNVTETAIAYEVDVVTRDNSPVNKVIVDKKTGQMRTQY